jgi:uncharacterized membrane protein YcaP (DUF421 family)
MQPFDWQRIFFADSSIGFLLEIIFRTAVLYLYTLAILRLIGQRGMERLSSFDFAIVIAMGSAVGDPMFYPEVPLLHGMAVVTTILAVERGLGWITKKSAAAEKTIEGVTREAVKDGRVNLDYLEKSLLSQAELFMKLRHHGVRNLGEVEAAYLELDGAHSVFLFAPEAARPGLPLVPPWDIQKPPLFEAGAATPKEGIYACAACGDTQPFQQGERFPACQRCKQESQWLRAALPGRHAGRQA